MAARMAGVAARVSSQDSNMTQAVAVTFIERFSVSARDTIPISQDFQHDTGCSCHLLTGFLGAGKTTLLNHFLRHHGDASVAIPPRTSLCRQYRRLPCWREAPGSAWWSSATAASAAACGEFGAALRDLVFGPAGDGELQFERPIVETTGLPIPPPSFRPSSLKRRCGMPCAWMPSSPWPTVKHIGRQLDEHPVAVAQLASPDRILSPRPTGWTRRRGQPPSPDPQDQCQGPDPT